MSVDRVHWYQRRHKVDSRIARAQELLADLEAELDSRSNSGTHAISVERVRTAVHRLQLVLDPPSKRR